MMLLSNCHRLYVLPEAVTYVKLVAANAASQFKCSDRFDLELRPVLFRTGDGEREAFELVFCWKGSPMDGRPQKVFRRISRRLYYCKDDSLANAILGVTSEGKLFRLQSFTEDLEFCKLKKFELSR